MDCFYAAVHMRDDPELRGKPVLIGGDPERRGVVAAASYEARRYGVRSAMPSARARRLCPSAIFLRPEFHRYREESKKVFEIFRSFTPLVQAVSIDEAYLDVSDQLGEMGSATAVARAIRKRVLEQRGLTVSIGVGPNRLVAKIASDFDKPDGLTVVPPARVLEFLAPLPVRALQGVGPATASRLADWFGIETVAELRRVPERELVARLGRYGGTLFQYARGVDDRPVVVHRQRKSLSAERTFDRDLVELTAVVHEVQRLARSVGHSLARRALAAATVVLKVRYGDFSTITRSATLSAPTQDPALLATVACRLLERTEVAKRPVRLLGVGAAKLAGIASAGRQLALPSLERPRH
jgi:DNA polymerase-4